LQGSKKVPSGLSGQVDLPAGQVTFQSHLPNGQAHAYRSPTSLKNVNLVGLALGKQNLRAACPNGEAEIQVFFKPWLWFLGIIESIAH